MWTSVIHIIQNANLFVSKIPTCGLFVHNIKKCGPHLCKFHNVNLSVCTILNLRISYFHPFPCNFDISTSKRGRSGLTRYILVGFTIVWSPYTIHIHETKPTHTLSQHIYHPIHLTPHTHIYIWMHNAYILFQLIVLFCLHTCLAYKISADISVVLCMRQWCSNIVPMTPYLDVYVIIMMILAQYYYFMTSYNYVYINPF